MGSGAQTLSRYVNEHPNVTIDVGQVIFGQTVTISADEAAQFANRVHANPKHWLLADVECQAGCGVVPMRYSDKNYVHSLQWTIGLELLLLIEDPWRVFLTTDHPNGGPFTSYPHLIRLLMDRTFRQAMLERIHPVAARERRCERLIASIRSMRSPPSRERLLHAFLDCKTAERWQLVRGLIWSLIASRLIGRQRFASASLVLKNGVEVIRDGVFTGARPKKASHVAMPELDDRDVSKWREQIESCLRVPANRLVISSEEMQQIALGALGVDYQAR